MLLIRIAEGLLLIALGGAALVISLLPLILALKDVRWEDVPSEQLLDVLASKASAAAMAALLLLVVFGAALLVALAIHSFVQAGITGIYIDGERRAGSLASGSFSSFTMSRWTWWGRQRWWKLFLLYNLVWGAFGLLLLVPLLLIAAPVLIWRDSPVVLIGGCAAMVALTGFTILAALLVGLWSLLASIICVRSGSGPGESMKLALTVARVEIRDFLFVVGGRIAAGIALQTIFGFAWFFVNVFSNLPHARDVLLPFQMSLTTGQLALSIPLSAWFLAGLTGVALGSERNTVHAAQR